MKSRDNIDFAMLKYRKEHFGIEITPCSRPLDKNELSLNVTHNGYQWFGFSLLPEEAEQLLAKLRTYLDSLP